MQTPHPDQVAEMVQALAPAFEAINTIALRDRIATEAMGRLIADWCYFPDETGPHPGERQEMRLLSLQAYRFADAMLAAREVKQ